MEAILILAFFVYVLVSLSTIKSQLNLIIKHFNITDEKVETISYEEIEKELENDKEKE